MTGQGAIPDRVYDRGAQQERTELAWTRTAMAVVVVGALMLRVGALAGGPVLLIPGFVLLALGAIIFDRSARRYVVLHGILRGGASVVSPLARLLVIAMVSIGLCGAALTVLAGTARMPA